MTRIFKPLSAAALAAILSTQAALAACPMGPEAAAKGIAVTYDDGGRSVTLLDPATGDTVETFSYPDGYVMRSDLMWGLNTLRAVDLDAAGAEVPGSEYLYVYAAPRPEALAPGLQWQSDYNGGGASDSFTGVYTMSVGAETRVTIGGCSYLAWPVTMFSKDPEFSYLVQADYLPELRIGVLRGYGELLDQKIVVTPMTIEAVE